MVCVQYSGNLEFPRICIFVISLYVLLLAFLQYFVEALAEPNSMSYNAREAPRLAKLEIAPSLPPTGGESTPPPPHTITPPPPPPPPNRRPPPPSPAPLSYAFYYSPNFYYPPSRPSYNSTVIVALPILAFILIFICSFIWSHNQRVNANQAAMAGGDTGTSSDTAAPPPAAQMQGGQGLNSALVNKLPTLLFREQKSRGLKKGRKEYLYSCAVCISDFEEGETLKLLPACGHAFHKDCIDMWLFSHSTCPLCRLGLVNNKGELILPEEDEASDSQRGAHVAVDLGERVSRSLDHQVLSPLIKMFRRTQSSIDWSQAGMAGTRGSFPLQRSSSQPLRASSKIHPSHSFA